MCVWHWGAFFSEHHSKNKFIPVIGWRLSWADERKLFTGLITLKEPSVDCVSVGILSPEAVLETWIHPNGFAAFKCEITWCNLAQYTLPQVSMSFRGLGAFHFTEISPDYCVEWVYKSCLPVSSKEMLRDRSQAQVWADCEEKGVEILKAMRRRKEQRERKAWACLIPGCPLARTGCEYTHRCSIHNNTL